MTFGDRIRRFSIGALQFLFAKLKLVLRLMLIILAIIILVPAVLTLLYSSTSINPVSTLMVARFVSGKPVERKWVKLDDINTVLVHSVMMSEDAKFCAHNGIDYEALNQVIDNASLSSHTAASGIMVRWSRNAKYGWLCVDDNCSYYSGTASGITASGVRYFYY